MHKDKWIMASMLIILHNQRKRKRKFAEAEIDKITKVANLGNTYKV
jgi:hypothetical protein